MQCLDMLALKSVCACFIQKKKLIFIEKKWCFCVKIVEFSRGSANRFVPRSYLRIRFTCLSTNRLFLNLDKMRHEYKCLYCNSTMNECNAFLKKSNSARSLRKRGILILHRDLSRDGSLWLGSLNICRLFGPEPEFSWIQISSLFFSFSPLLFEQMQNFETNFVNSDSFLFHWLLITSRLIYTLKSWCSFSDDVMTNFQ